MNLELSEEQEHLAEGLRGLLDGSDGVRRMRAQAYEGDGSDPELWAQLVDSGWSSALLPEDAGGLGLGFEEAMVIAIECGRDLLHLPLCETLLATRAAARAGTEAARALLEAIAEGASVTLALGGDASGLNDAVGDGVRAGADGRLGGKLRSVPFGPLAAQCLVEAGLEGGGRGLLLIETGTDGADWTERGGMDLSVRRFDLTLDGAPARTLVEGDAGEAIDHLLDEWRVLLAAQTEGAARHALELTADYVKKREQFGRPVGSNQAIKVRIAEMGAAVERMRAAVYFAALAVESDHPERALAVAMAKAESSVPGSFVATQAIHAHGAIGYTWEQDVHLFAKRIKSNELLLGAESEMLARVANEVLGGGA